MDSSVAPRISSQCRVERSLLLCTVRSRTSHFSFRSFMYQLIKNTMLFKTIILTVFILSFQESSCEWQLETVGFKKNFTFLRENNKINIDEPMISSNRTHFHRIECARERKRSSCNITREIYEHSDMHTPSYNRTCSFKLGGKKTVPLVLNELIQLGKNRLAYDIIYSKLNTETITELFLERKLLTERKIQVVDLKNCELIRDVKVEIETTVDASAKLLLRPGDSGRFDVIYTDSDICKSEARARISYNRDGNLLDGPVCILDSVKSLKSSNPLHNTNVMTFSEEEFFVLNRDGWKWGGYLVNYTDNELKELFRGECNWLHCVPEIRVSTDHNRILYCLIMGREFPQSIKCFLVNSTTTEETEMTLNFPYKVLEFEVHNLKNGEFLTLTGKFEDYEPGKDEDDDDEEGDEEDEEYEEEYEQQARNFESRLEDFIQKNTKDVETNFEMRRYKSDGTLIGKPIQVDGWSCRNPLVRDRVSIVEVSPDRVCVNFICRNEEKKQKKDWQIDIKLKTRCLTL